MHETTATMIWVGFALLGIAGLVLMGAGLLWRATGSLRSAAGPAPPAPAPPPASVPVPVEQPVAAPAPEEKAPEPPPASVKRPVAVAAVPRVGETDEEDLTQIVLPLPRLAGGDDEDDDESETQLKAEAEAIPLFYDDESAAEEQSLAEARLLVTAVAQTDTGRRRKNNEDCYQLLPAHSVFTVADGMGGHAGGEIASKLAVDTIAQAFDTQTFVGKAYPNVPRRGSDLVVAIQMANQAIHELAQQKPAYKGMGTTVVSARFSPDRQRLYIGHVGDSRCYRLRGKELRQLTTDHTFGQPGLKGPFANRLTRAVGVEPTVQVDLIIARPELLDTYLICSDGLSKMVPEDELCTILREAKDVDDAVVKLVARANERGGKDNITAILVQVVATGASG